MESYYLENNFHYAQGIGHINYNYFLIDNIRQLSSFIDDICRNKF